MSDAAILLPPAHSSGLEWDTFGLNRASLEDAYLEACRSIPDVCGELLDQGTAPLVCAFLIRDAGDVELMEVPFGERLHDRRRPERSRVPCEQTDWQAEVQRARNLVAEMRARITEIRASAAEMRTTARGAYPLVERE